MLYLLVIAEEVVVIAGMRFHFQHGRSLKTIHTLQAINIG
jgi:hypothetical protein